jgi:outer membrane murein-binding lipoprotein Lpp
MDEQKRIDLTKANSLNALKGKKPYSALQVGAISAVIAIAIISSGFGAYIYVNNSKAEKEKSELAKQVRDLNSKVTDLEANNPTQAPLFLSPTPTENVQEPTPISSVAATATKSPAAPVQTATPTPALKKYTNSRYAFSMMIPNNWHVEVLNLNQYEHGCDCEELIITDPKSIDSGFHMAVTGNGEMMNFSQKGIPGFYSEREEFIINMQGKKVNRYRLVALDEPSHLIGYSYNIKRTSGIEAEDFTGEIKIKNLTFGAYTDRSDIQSVEAFQKALESLVVN